MKLANETLILRCACKDVYNPSGAAAWHMGDPAWFDEAERKFRGSHQGAQCSVEVKREVSTRQGRLL